MRTLRVALIVAAGVSVLVAVAAVVLSTWSIPAPSTRVERVIPNERLNR